MNELEMNYASSMHQQQQQQLQLQQLQNKLKNEYDNNEMNIPQNNGGTDNSTNNNNNNSSSNSVNNNIFNDTLSPFFAPYGIDVSHFPLTNPPIFESALMMNNQGQPRRRISISNGQIGQITTTHTLENDDIYDIQPPPLPKQQSQDDLNLINPQFQPQGPTQQQLQQQQQQQAQNQQQQLQQQQQQYQFNSSIPAQPVPQHQSIDPHAQPLPAQQLPPQPHQLQQQQPQQFQQLAPHQLPPQPQHAPQHAPQKTNGVPLHKLVYNNEVIFNPESGPIPGTAAWKKARLLERNRIAASKCRQRKKAAQLRLKEDVEKYQSTLKSLNGKLERLEEFYFSVNKLFTLGKMSIEDSQTSRTFSDQLLKLADAVRTDAEKKFILNLKKEEENEYDD